MERRKFDEYDKKQMEQAKRLLIKVYEYNYGASYMRSELNRLKTIIAKLELLQNKSK